MDRVRLFLEGAVAGLEMVDGAEGPVFVELEADAAEEEVVAGVGPSPGHSRR